MTIMACSVALNISYVGLLLMVLSIMMKRQPPLRNIPNLKLECKTNTSFMTKIAKIGILFLTGKGLKTHTLQQKVPLVSHYTTFIKLLFISLFQALFCSLLLMMGLFLSVFLFLYLFSCCLSQSLNCVHIFNVNLNWLE